MIARLLEPFLEAYPWWRSRPWLLAVLLALSPLVYFGGQRLQQRTAAESRHRMEGYPQIRARARATAKALGIRAEGWRESVRFSADAEMNRFERKAAARLPEAVRKVLPLTKVRVLLSERAGGQWVEFTYTGDGQLLRYQPSPGLFSKSEAIMQPGEGRGVAQAAVEAVLDAEAFEMGEPAVKTSDGGRAEQFTWNARARCCRELQVDASVTVEARRPAYFNAMVQFEPDYLRRRSSPLNLLSDILRWGFLFGAGFFVAFRFARRAMEGEVPLTRAAVVWGLVLAVSAVQLVLQPFAFLAFNDSVDLLIGPLRYFLLVVAALFALVMGLMLALAYGGTESDLRERFPLRLSSLDALLSGRVFSRNTGVAVIAGAAWGGWAYGLTQAARRLLAPGFIPLPESGLQFSYTNAPWLGLLCASLIDALTAAITIAPVALTVGIWLCRGRWPRLLLTAICSWAAVALPGSPFADAATMVIAVSALATVWFGLAGFDFLAAIVAIVVTRFDGSLTDLIALMPSWSDSALLARAVSVATLAVAFVAAYRGRRYEDAEVRPTYARNIEERLTREAEVSAAREAQLRLLPESPPDIPGLGLAAFCAPAQGVSGDFFDFFPMSRGRLGLLVADGRTGGLSAALTIALAKGFLQYAAHRDWAPGEALARLREVPRRDGDESADLNLAYAVLDPGKRQIRFARLGDTPLLLAGRDRDDCAQPLNGLSAGNLTEGSSTFAAGDVLLICTDGVPQRFAQIQQGSLDRWLSEKLRLTAGVTAYRIGEALHEALRASEGAAADDLTAVVIRFEPTAALEGVA